MVIPNLTCARISGRVAGVLGEDMAQIQSKTASGLDHVDPVWARIRIRGRRDRAARARACDLHLFDHPAPRHARGGCHRARGASGSHRPEMPAEVIRQSLCRSARGRSRDRARLPRRHRSHLRPRSRDRPFHRARALFQRLSCGADASPRALAVGQGPQGLRALPAKPLVVGISDRHPSSGADRAAASSSTTPPGWWSARPR